jgi:hypothetical protein
MEVNLSLPNFFYFSLSINPGSHGIHLLNQHGSEPGNMGAIMGAGMWNVKGAVIGSIHNTIWNSRLFSFWAKVGATSNTTATAPMPDPSMISHAFILLILGHWAKVRNLCLQLLAYVCCIARIPGWVKDYLECTIWVVEWESSPKVHNKCWYSKVKLRATMNMCDSTPFSIMYSLDKISVLNVSRKPAKQWLWALICRLYFTTVGSSWHFASWMRLCWVQLYLI